MVDPDDRISIPEILAHPWVCEEEDMFADSLGYGGYKTAQNFNGISPPDSDIDTVDPENLFKSPDAFPSLSPSNYFSITQDAATVHIDEDVLDVLKGYGFPPRLVKDSINKGELNHATACYNILRLSDKVHNVY